MYTSHTFVFHLQGIQPVHTECLAESSCRKPGYECSKVQLTSPPAKEAYYKALKKCSIYCHANFYCHVRSLCYYLHTCTLYNFYS